MKSNDNLGIYLAATLVNFSLSLRPYNQYICQQLQALAALFLMHMRGTKGGLVTYDIIRTLQQGFLTNFVAGNEYNQIPA